MTRLDDIIVPKVLEVLTTYGTDAVFTVPATKTYDADTGVTTEGTTTDHTVKASPPSVVREFQGGTVIATDRSEIYIPASGLEFTPKTSMTVTIAGGTWKIVAIEELRSGDDLAAYRIEIRR